MKHLLSDHIYFFLLFLSKWSVSVVIYSYRKIPESSLAFQSLGYGGSAPNLFPSEVLSPFPHRALFRSQPPPTSYCRGPKLQRPKPVLPASSPSCPNHIEPHWASRTVQTPPAPQGLSAVSCVHNGLPATLPTLRPSTHLSRPNSKVTSSEKSVPVLPLKNLGGISFFSHQHLAHAFMTSVVTLSLLRHLPLQSVSAPDPFEGKQ